MKSGCLCPVRLGLALGITWAIFTFILGIVAWQFHYGSVIVAMMASVYIGYAPSLVGSLIGALWGLVDMFIFGLLAGFIYNVFCRCRCQYCKCENCKCDCCKCPKKEEGPRVESPL